MNFNYSNETMIMKILNHPGIVKFHETIETTTHIYLIMELFKGGDLLQYIQKFNFLEEYEASRIFKYIVETIIYLHNAGSKKLNYFRYSSQRFKT
jgi:serine/threonine protein kinase